MSNTTHNITERDIPEWLFVLFGVYLSLADVLGILANGSALFIFCKFSRLRTPPNVYLIGLLCTDFGMCLLGTPLAASSMYAGRWLYRFPACVFSGFIVYFLGINSMYILVALSVNRYTVITRPTHKKTTFKSVGVTLFLCAFFALFWSTIPFSGWTRYEFEGAGTSCAVAYDSADLRVLSYNIVIFVFCFLLPVSIMVYCYYCIFAAIRLMGKNKLFINKGPLMKRQMRLEQRLAKTFFIMIGAFLMSWTPYAIIAFWRAFGGGQPPVAAITLPAVIAKTSSVWNPFIYAFSNTQFKTALTELVTCKTVRDNNVNLTLSDCAEKGELLELNRTTTNSQQTENKAHSISN